jgi:predicted AAA+ superfamily ATPase
VVIGPRQVGKTTAIKQLLAEHGAPHHYVAADLPSPPEAEWILEQWERARALIGKKDHAVLVLDEVQKINRWSEVVKRLWDEDRSAGRDLRVVILGSSSLVIQKGLTESLAGRFELVRFPHWQFAECERCFGWNLDQYLFFGGYPGAAAYLPDESRWAAYVKDSLIETAISKDILLLHPIEKPALLRKLFALACEYGGQILSYNKMLGQLTDAGNTVTLAAYKRLLEAAFLIAGIDKFSGSRIKSRSSSPKWLPLNNALITSMSGVSFERLKQDASAWGRLVECAVGAHLFTLAAEHGLELFYWREGNYEVDYVLRKGRDLLAIEVKSGTRKIFVSGLEHFSRRYKSRKVLIGGSGIPVEEALKMQPADFL